MTTDNSERIKAVVKSIAAAVPTSWLDSLLTGERNVFNPENAYATVERLLTRVKARVEETATAAITRHFGESAPEQKGWQEVDTLQFPADASPQEPTCAQCEMERKDGESIGGRHHECADEPPVVESSVLPSKSGGE